MLEGFSFSARIIKKNNYCSSLFLIPDVAFLGLKHVELCSLICRWRNAIGLNDIL